MLSILPGGVQRSAVLPRRAISDVLLERRYPMALQLNHVHLKTTDPKRTAQWYVDNLGATIVSEAGANGYRLDLHGLALNVTTFIDSQKREQHYGMEHIAIDTDELDTLVDKLKASGINI